MKPPPLCWTHVGDGVILRRHVPGLDTVDIDWGLALHQRCLPFKSRRHEERHLGRTALVVGFRQAF